MGATILGAFLGRKSINVGTIGRATTAARGAGRVLKETQDVGRAKETVAAVDEAIAALDAEFKAEADALGARTDPLTEPLETIALKPTRQNISVRLVALAWAPAWQRRDRPGHPRLGVSRSGGKTPWCIVVDTPCVRARSSSFSRWRRCSASPRRPSPPHPRPPHPTLSPGGRGELSGTVVRTVDGDTVWVRLPSGIEKVRYIGIDTPEVHHPTRGEEPGGRAATEINRGLVGDRPVRLEPDVQLRDRYGRLLAYVWVRRADGVEVMVNAEMVRLGYAQVMTIPPNVRHAEMFRKLAAEAREQRRGLWAP